ncbi:hypothetical protein AB5J72_03130 [Streptomyces sp. CG1]|uniref:hypothetical protein n=1 Tax=Streptomyces sp. CG1 TaxID=1287523 RepID=UPI0034E2C6B4
MLQQLHVHRSARQAEDDAVVALVAARPALRLELGWAWLMGAFGVAWMVFARRM